MTRFPTGPVPGDGDLLAALGGCTVLDCRVRVVRAGGWSWGPDPAALARGAIALLPGIVAAHLAGALDGSGASLLPGAPGQALPDAWSAPPDRELTEPVRIRSTVTLAELLRAAAEPMPPGDAAVAPPDAGGADVRCVDPGGAPPFMEGLVGADVPPGRGDGPVSAEHDHDRVLVGLLAEAAACGALDAVLAGLPHGTLLLLVRALDAAGSRTTSEAPASGTASPAGPAAPGDANGEPAGAVGLTSAVLAALRRASSDGRNVTDTDPGAGPDPDPAASAFRSPGGPPLPRRPAPGRPRPFGPGPGPVSGTVVEVEHALPFLLLPPLHDRGWAAALAAVLAGGGAPDEDAVALAACLARKVLPPPAHGWLRTPEEVRSVAVFAGAGAVVAGRGVPDFSVADLERRVGPLLPLLDARLGLQTARGHTPGSPVLLHAVAPDRLLLLDVDGLYPMVEARRPADLLRPWELAGRPLVLLPTVAGGLTSALDILGIRFVTDVPPVRGERLSRVPGPRRCWTNSPSPDAVVGAARRLAREAPRAARFAQELVELRPADRAGRATAVECATTLAAGVGLADLAWKLWSEREAPDPVTALERFGGLSARVTFHDGTVEIRLPLGPRHADLYRHRLLADVPDVPWFGGRTVVFTGG
ncbi:MULTISPECIES: hypothetical protein [Streptomyces]|uniref:Uncharacterized protein n=2 Tax=Streptomyces TaxID=1883 RepID=A0ABV9IJ95_9ACTN